MGSLCFVPSRACSSSLIASFVMSLACLSGCASSGARTSAATATSTGASDASGCFDGQVTYYADSLAGHRTANGEVYDPERYTAAHRSLPFGTLVEVERAGHRVTVKVNDRGPYSGSAVLDVSRAAAERLGMLRAGRVGAHMCVVPNRQGRAVRR